jgi:hypothetical protein
MDAGAAAPWQGQTQDGKVSRRTKRGTSLQGMLPAGNVATSKPISSRCFSSSEGLRPGGNGPVMRWVSSRCRNCTLGHRQTELNKFLAEPNHATRRRSSLGHPDNHFKVAAKIFIMFERLREPV